MESGNEGIAKDCLGVMAVMVWLSARKTTTAHDHVLFG